jgi:hypothetical protein
MRKRLFYTPLPDYVIAGTGVAQSIATAAIVKLTNLVHLAGDGMTWDSVNDRVKVNGHGIYTFVAEVTFAAHATGQRGIYIFFNGFQFVNRRTVANNTAGALHYMNTLVTAELVGLQEGALIDIRAFQSSGAALNVNAAQLTIIKHKAL